MLCYKSFSPFTIVLITISILVAVQGCKNIGLNSAKEVTSFADSLLAETDTLKLVGANLTEGALSSLTDPAGQAKLDSTAKKLAAAIGHGVSPTILALLDSLDAQALNAVDSLASALRRELQSDETIGAVTEIEDAVLARLEASVARIKNDLLSEQTGRQLGEVITTALNQQTFEQLQAARDSVFNAAFQQYVVGIVAEAGDTLAVKLDDVLREGKEVGTEILVLGGLFIAGLMVLCWILFRRGRELEARKQELETLQTKQDHLGRLINYQIHTMPAQQSYDDLVARIQSEAQREGLEPLLQSQLREQGILGTQAWRAGQ